MVKYLKKSGAVIKDSSAINCEDKTSLTHSTTFQYNENPAGFQMADAY
jgi:hypothetical protein